MDSIGNFFSSIGDWFSNLFGGNKDLGILGETKDDMLGSNAVINATDKAAENLPSSEEVEGFFQKIINWFTNLFNNDSDNNDSNNNDVNSGESNQENNTQTPSQEESNNNVENNTNSNTDNTENSDNTQDSQNSENNTNDNSLNVQTETEEHFDNENSN